MYDMLSSRGAAWSLSSTHTFHDAETRATELIRRIIFRSAMLRTLDSVLID
jgi:hypothetical protein